MFLIKCFKINWVYPAQFEKPMGSVDKVPREVKSIRWIYEDLLLNLLTDQKQNIKLLHLYKHHKIIYQIQHVRKYQKVFKTCFHFLGQ